MKQWVLDLVENILPLKLASDIGLLSYDKLDDSLLSSYLGMAGAGLAGAGLAGAGGSLYLQSSCSGPFFCRALSGKCCLVVLQVSGILCPDTC